MTEVVLPSSAVLEFAALSTRHIALLKEWLTSHRDAGVPRALLAWAEADKMGGEELKTEMAAAFDAAKAENERAASLVYGIFFGIPGSISTAISTPTMATRHRRLHA
ncbi:hypothetical protein [Streptomyces longisporoflavus]|uniref:Uncharacterized protein n=1 Tax=Streptomyces longisporoflavus TaxID=28044 RepID=A0ABW7QN74_9ACTN